MAAAASGSQQTPQKDALHQGTARRCRKRWLPKPLRDPRAAACLRLCRLGVPQVHQRRRHQRQQLLHQLQQLPVAVRVTQQVQHLRCAPTTAATHDNGRLIAGSTKGPGEAGARVGAG